MLIKGFNLVHRLAQTLTGPPGQLVQRVVIPDAAPRGHQTRRRGDSLSHNPITSRLIDESERRVIRRTSSQNLRAKIEAEKMAKKSLDDTSWWSSQLEEIRGINDIKGRWSKFNSILRNKRIETGWLAVEASLFQLHLTILDWLAENESKSDSVCKKYTVLILRSIHQLSKNPSLFPSAAQILMQVLVAIGFNSITLPTTNLQEERELGFKFVDLVDSESGELLYPHLHISMSCIEFQLKYYGEFMDRSMGGMPDNRVRFEPDGWQREVGTIEDTPIPQRAFLNDYFYIGTRQDRS